MLTPAQEAVSILRDEDPFGLDFVAVLSALSRRLSIARKADEAIATQMEVVEIHREFKRRDIPESHFALAQALHDLYKYFSAASKWREALKAIKEAACLDAISYRSTLRKALHDYLEKVLWELKEVLDYVGDDGENSDVYRVELDHALSDAYEYHKAIEGNWKAVFEVLGEAASRNPSRYDTELNQALNDAFDYYKVEGEWDKALYTVREAADENPRVFGPLLRQARVEYRTTTGKECCV